MKKRGLILTFVFAVICAGCYKPVSEDRGSFEARTPDESAVNQTDGSSPAENMSNENTTDSSSETMNDSKIPAAGFRANVTQNLAKSGLSLSGVANESNPVEKRVFEEYGAVYLTRAKPPSKAMFTTESEVSVFQQSVGIARETIGGSVIELQPAAMEALKAAVNEAKSKGQNITPRDGAEAGRRTYAKTLELWNSRFSAGLKHWKSKGRLTDSQIAGLRSMPIKEQVAGVLELEKDGIYFNTFFNNSILYSVAAPGTSQHLSMLAFDVTEFADPQVQQIMGNHGWFRTVQNDAPHFTYLGYKESELTGIGLRRVEKKDGSFWIPAL